MQANFSFFKTIDDVWDDDSAYMELLAEEVKKKLSADSFLNDPVLTNIFLTFRVHVFEKELKKKGLMEMRTRMMMRTTSKRSWALSVL